MAVAAVAPALAGGAYAQVGGPVIVGVSSPDHGGAFDTGKIVAVSIEFSEDVDVAGTPTLALATDPPRNATYAGGSGSRDIGFWYTVRPGDDAAGLDYAGTDALSLNGGNITSRATGTAANTTLPEPGSPGSLAPRNIWINTAERPALVPVGKATNGSGGFSVLGGAQDVSVFSMGADTYAIVASNRDSGVQLIRIHANGTLEPINSATGSNSNPTEFRLEGPQAITAFRLGDSMQALVASWSNGVQGIRILADGTLVPNGTMIPGQDDFAGITGITNVDALDIGNKTYAVATGGRGQGQGGVHLILVSPNGTLSPADSATDDDGDLVLAGARGVDMFKAGNGSAYAIVAAGNDAGVQLLRIHDDGTLSDADSVTNDDDGFDRLAGGHDISAFEASDGTMYAIVAARSGNGVQLIRINDDGTLSPAGSAVDSGSTSATSFAELQGAHAIDTFKVADTTYAIVAARNDRGVQLVRIHDDDGTLSAAGWATDDRNGFDNLQGASGVDAFEMDGDMYAIVAAHFDHGVQLIRLSPAYVVDVSTSAQNRTYAAGESIDIAVRFSENVTVDGDEPRLALATGSASAGTGARYASGAGTDTLTFRYTVEPGDDATDLDYADAGALQSRGTIRGAGNHVVDTELPEPGERGSLSNSSDIVVRTSPGAFRVSSSDAGGAYGTGKIVSITVKFSVDVDVAGAPTLALATDPPRNATYAGGSRSPDIAFWYTVRPGDAATNLDYTGAGALSLNGGSITNRATGEAVNTTLPEPGSYGSLALSGISINTAQRPALVPVGSATNGSGGFSALGGARDVSAFSMGNETYAVVASKKDSGVQLLRIHANATLEPISSATGPNSDNTRMFRLAGTDAITAFMLGDSIQALTASWNDGVQGIRILANGTLVPNGTMIPGQNGFANIGAIFNVDALDIGNKTYAMAIGGRGQGQGGVHLILVNPNGTLSPADSALDNVGGLVLAGARAVDMFKAGNGSAYAIVAAETDNGVQLFRIANGTLVAVGSAINNVGGFDRLAGAYGASAFEASDGTMYAIVAARSGNGVQLLRINDDGTLSAADSAGDGTNGFAELRGAQDIDTFKVNSTTYAIVASRYDNGVQLVRIHDGGTLLAAGWATDNRTGFGELEGASGVDVFEMDGDMYAIVSSYFDDGVQLIRLSPASVVDVSTSAQNRTYAAGEAIDIAVRFSENVTVAGAEPKLVLATGVGAGTSARYTSGGGTDTLTFRYTVAPGDAATDLDYAGAGALQTRGAIRGAGNHAVNLELPVPGERGSLGNSSEIMIDALPGVLRVSSPDAGGTYGTGKNITITVEFSDAVDVTDGTPTLALATVPPRNATYDSGSGGSRIAFLYTVQPGDAATNLDYTDMRALSLNGGRITAGGMPVNATLPEPGSPNSLAPSGITIDTRPAVLSVSSPDDDGTYGTGKIIAIAVEFSEAVDVAGGTPTLALATVPPRNATYDSGSGGSRIAFWYAVQPGDTAADLDYAGAGALSLNGGSIRNADGTDANLTLPAPGSRASLGAMKDIEIYAAQPPALVPAGSATNGSGGFGMLSRAQDVSAFSMGGDAYAIVASSGVQLLRIHGDGTLEPISSATGRNVDLSREFMLEGPQDVITLDLGGDGGGGVQALVTLWTEGVQGIRVHQNGTLSPNSSATHGSADFGMLHGTTGIDTIETGGNTYVVLGMAGNDRGIQLLSMRSNGTLVGNSSAALGDPHNVGGNRWDMAAFQMNGTAYAIAAARSDDGVWLVEISPNGTLSLNASATDGVDGFDELEGASGVDVFEMDGDMYAIVASRDDHGVQLLRIGSNGTLSAMDSAANGRNGFNELWGAYDIDTFRPGGDGDMYAIATARDGAGVQLLRIGSNGTLSAAGWASDDRNGFGELEGASGVDVFEMDGDMYAIVSSYFDDGVQLIRLSPAYVVDVSAQNGTYAVGEAVDIAVRFSENVTLAGAEPKLVLATGGAGGTGAAEYASGGGTDTLTFRYTVVQGDAAADLDYAGTGALQTRGAIRGAGNHAVNLELAVPGECGSLGNSSNIAIGAAQPGGPDGSTTPCEEPDGGMMPEEPDGGMMPEEPDGGMMPEEPDGGTTIRVQGGMLDAADNTTIVAGPVSVVLEPSTNVTDRSGMPYTGVINVTVASSDRRATAVGAVVALADAVAGERVGIVVEVGDPGADIVLDAPASILLRAQPAPGTVYHMNSTGGVSTIPACGSTEDPAGWLAGNAGTTPFCHVVPDGDERTKDYAIYTYRLSAFFVAGEPTALERQIAQAAAGGTVRIDSGTYAVDMLIVDRPMTIEPADPADPPVFTGSARVVVTPAENGSIIVRNLAFENTARGPGQALITVASTADRPAPGGAMPVVIEGNTFRNTCDGGIRAAADQGAAPIAGLVIEGNKFYGVGANNGSSCEAASAQYGADAIVVGRHDAAFAAGGAVQVANLTVRDNYIFGAAGAGIRVAGADGAIVERNHVEDAAGGAGIALLPSRGVEVRLNTVIGANGGAAIEVWSGSDDVAVTLNRISGSAGAFYVCAGTCDPGAAGSAASVQVDASDVGSPDGANDIRFNHNVIAASNTGTLIANDAGGMLNARANYYPGHALSAAVDSLYLASPSRAGGTVQVAPTLDGAGPVRIGAIVADGAGSPVRSTEAAVRAAFELGIRDFNAMQAAVGGFVGLEPIVHSVQSPDYTPSAQAEHAAALGTLRSGAGDDARMLPILHNSISAAMAAYDGNQTSALAAISAMAATYGHYPFVVARDGMIVAHGANASLVGDSQTVRGLAGGTDAALAALLDFSSADSGVAPGRPDAPWKWWTYEFADPAAAGETRSKRSAIALHPGPDGTLHNGDDLVFGAGYYPPGPPSHMVVSAGDAPAAVNASDGMVIVSPTSTAAQLAAPDMMFRLAPPDTILAGVVVEAATSRSAAGGAASAVIALNDSASLQSMGLAGELARLDRQGALPDRLTRGGGVTVVSYNSSEPGWGAGAAGGIRSAAGQQQQQSGSTAVVYSGRAGAFADLAAAFGNGSSAQPPADTAWYATGELGRAELALMSSSSPSIAPFARAASLVVISQHASPSTAVDSALAASGMLDSDLDISTRGAAYAAYDAAGLLGRAITSTAGVPGSPADVASALQNEVVRTHSGALGSLLVLDSNGDLVLPVAYARSLFPAAAGGEWRSQDQIEGERTCGILLEKSLLDFGIIAPGQRSRIDTQTVVNSGTLQYDTVTLVATQWTYAGTDMTLPTSITELRELGSTADFADLASGLEVASDLDPGMNSRIQYRLDLSAYSTLDTGEISQTVNYSVECSASS